MRPIPCSDARRGRTLLSTLIVGSVICSSCALQQELPTVVATEPALPTAAPAPLTRTPTAEPALATSAPTPSPTPTPVPQPVLLRRACSRDYVVRADKPLEIFYGGWGVSDAELAEQWATAYLAELTIDGVVVDGSQQPPTQQLPHNCSTGSANPYWLFYRALLPGLAVGEHQASVTFIALRPLPDGYGKTYGPGQIGTQTFRIRAE